ncbi:MAG: hypothetical protein H7Z43_11330, partial [Clostridia bacterium]|nr:hypothetical protein [Deltaproteobacteria bacterium]
SPRPWTVSSKRFEDDIPEELKKQRNQEMIALQDRMSLANNASHVGTTIEVLVEGETKLRRESAPVDGVVIGWAAKSKNVRLMGRTGGDEIVAFDGPRELLGTMTKVRVTSATSVLVLGELVAPVMINHRVSELSANF